MSYSELSEYLRKTCCKDGKPSVVIERVENKRLTSIINNLNRILVTSSADSFLQQWRNQKILLKPNFCRVGPKGVTTSIEAIEATLGILQDYSCKVILGDGMTQAFLPYRDPNGFNKVAEQLSDVLRKYNISFVHFDEPQEKRIPVEADGFIFYLPPMLQDIAGILNLAVLKVHPQMVGSFSVKNFMGLLSGPDRLELHRTGIADGIWRLQACLGKIIPQQIHLVDGLFSFQGYDASPQFVEPDIFIGGLNPCAVDFVCAKLMGMNPKRQFPQYSIALQNGFAYGQDKPLHLEGVPLEQVRFQCSIPSQLNEPPPSFPSVRIIWGKFNYPMNQSVKDLFRAMDRDIPIDIYVGGAAPTSNKKNRWRICLGNESIAAYKDNFEHVITIPGDPPAGVEFRSVLQKIGSEVSMLSNK